MTRTTPLLDAWRTDVRRALSPRGQKAELARHLAKRYGREQRSWESHISQIIAGRLAPNGEILLAINAWIKSTNGSQPENDARRSD